MSRTIKYFMWGYQPHFRISLEVAVEGAFREIGFRHAAQVFLVGFLAEGQDGWPICIEPEDGPFHPDQLTDVEQAADKIYAADPNSRLRHSHPRAHANYHRRLRDRARATALAQSLEGLQAGTRFFVGGSARVDKYEVHSVIGLEAATLADVPQVTTTERDRVSVRRSLLDATMTEIFEQSGAALTRAQPGAGLGEFDEPAETARKASADLLDTAAVLSGYIMGGRRLYNAVNAVATTRYEKEASVGSFVLAERDHQLVDVRLALTQTVSLLETRAVRKLLQASSDSFGLLCDGRDVFGFGAVSPDYDPASEDIFTLDVTGEGTWQLVHANVTLMRVRFEHPRLPSPRMDQDRFLDSIQRVFDGIGGLDPAELWEYALVAAEQAHGTMIVVTTAASTESDRLGAQSFPVEPARPNRLTLSRMTQTDGAVLLSPDGVCHGFGVILDGTATGEGDRARGARYNSAIRYLTSTRYPTAIILVSEDGMIDVFPELMPRIERTVVEQAVADVIDQATADPPSYETFSRAWDRISALRFYLSPDQCDELNRVSQEVEDRSLSESGMTVRRQALSPDPSMNETYFLESE